MEVKTQTIEKKTYISEDGREFSDEKSCIRHEAELKIIKFKEHSESKCTHICDVEFDCLLEFYFDIHSDTTNQIIRMDVNNEEDLELIDLLYEYYTGTRSDTPLFKIGEQYVFLLRDMSTMMQGPDWRIYYTTMTHLIDYLNKMIELTKEMFGDNVSKYNYYNESFALERTLNRLSKQNGL